MELPGAETRCSKTRYFLMEELTFYTYDSTDRISHPHNPVNGPTVSQLISTIKKKKKKTDIFTSQTLHVKSNSCCFSTEWLKKRNTEKAVKREK